MIAQVLGAWLHFLAIFFTLATLVAELALFRRDLSADALRVLGKVDRFYGLGALAILLTGAARVLWFGKGWEFYVYNPVFWVKVSVFAAVGIISIWPTVYFIRLARGTKGGQAPVISEREFRRTRRQMWHQLALFGLLPLLAAMMARGVGM